MDCVGDWYKYSEDKVNIILLLKIWDVTVPVIFGQAFCHFLIQADIGCLLGRKCPERWLA